MKKLVLPLMFLAAACSNEVVTSKPNQAAPAPGAQTAPALEADAKEYSYSLELVGITVSDSGNMFGAAGDASILLGVRTSDSNSEVVMEKVVGNYSPVANSYFEFQAPMLTPKAVAIDHCLFDDHGGNPITLDVSLKIEDWSGLNESLINDAQASMVFPDAQIFNEDGLSHAFPLSFTSTSNPNMHAEAIFQVRRTEVLPAVIAPVEAPATVEAEQTAPATTELN